MSSDPRAPTARPGAAGDGDALREAVVAAAAYALALAYAYDIEHGQKLANWRRFGMGSPEAAAERWALRRSERTTAAVVVDACLALLRIADLLAGKERAERENASLRARNHVEHQRWLSAELDKAERERDALKAALVDTDNALGLIQSGGPHQPAMTAAMHQAVDAARVSARTALAHHSDASADPRSSETGRREESDHAR